MLSVIFRLYCFVCGILVTAAAALLLTAGHWLDPKDHPDKADAIVVLGGSYTRPPYAAELYLKGLAPKIFLGRQTRSAGERVTDDLKLPSTRMEELYKTIIVNKGVPEAAVEFYGDDLLSTVQEAESLRRVLPAKSGKLIVVTSGYHSRRAKLIFSEVFPGWEVMACSTPYEPLGASWWNEKESAIMVFLEIPKTVYYLLGGKFRSASGQAAAKQAG